MGDDLASTNANRSYSLATTSIAILTFVLFFLYPRFRSGEVSALLFQTTVLAMGVATFSLALAALHYYSASLGNLLDDAERALDAQRGDHLWLLGVTLLFLAPSLILFSIGLFVVGSAWLALWLAYLFFAIRLFPAIRTARAGSARTGVVPPRAR